MSAESSNQNLIEIEVTKCNIPSRRTIKRRVKLPKTLGIQEYSNTGGVVTRNPLEDFINEYRKHLCLWDRESAEYRNQELKDAALDTLQELLRKIEPEAGRIEVVKRLNSLRSSYRKERNKIFNSKKNGRDQQHWHKPRLWYYNLLTFLDPELKFSTESIKSESNGDDLDQDTDCEMDDDSIDSGNSVDAKDMTYVQRSPRNTNGDFLKRIEVAKRHFKIIENKLKHKNDQSPKNPVPVYNSRYYLTEFISEYKKYPYLWNQKSTLPFDREEKQRALNTLQELLRKIDPAAGKSDVIKRLNSMKAGYRKERNKVNESVKKIDGSKKAPKCHIPRLWYYKLMTFLDDEPCPSLSAQDEDKNEHESQDGPDQEPGSDTAIKMEQDSTESKDICLNEEETSKKTLSVKPSSSGLSKKQTKRKTTSDDDKEIVKKNKPNDLSYSWNKGDIYSRQLKTAFINEYKNSVCLWDRKSLLFYCNKKLREDALNKLLQILKLIEPNAGRDSVLKRINSLRAKYRRERNIVSKSVIRNESNEIIQCRVPKLWYYRHMLFLDEEPCPSESQRHSGVDEDDQYSDDDYSSESIQDDLYTDDENSLDHDDDYYTANELDPLTSRTGVSSNKKENTNLENLPEFDHLEIKREKLSPFENIDLEDFTNPTDESIPDVSTPVKDEYDIMGKIVATKLRRLPNNVKEIAEKLINDVLYHAQMGNLSSESKLLCNKR